MAIAIFALAVPALAQVNDPTRPPGGSAELSGQMGVVDSGLSAVFFRHGAKPAALVNGVYVVQGGNLGDKRVLKITDSEVVLRGADGSREVLKLVTGAEKAPVKQSTTKADGKAGRTKGSE